MGPSSVASSLLSTDLLETREVERSRLQNTCERVLNVCASLRYASRLADAMTCYASDMTRAGIHSHDVKNYICENLPSLMSRLVLAVTYDQSSDVFNVSLSMRDHANETVLLESRTEQGELMVLAQTVLASTEEPLNKFVHGKIDFAQHLMDRKVNVLESTIEYLLESSAKGPSDNDCALDDMPAPSEIVRRILGNQNNAPASDASKAIQIAISRAEEDGEDRFLSTAMDSGFAIPDMLPPGYSR